VPPEGLNLAFFDPFGAKVFHWDTIARLGRVKRMDLLIHFPTSAIKRNFENPKVPRFKETIDRMFGNANWRSQVQDARNVARLIHILREQLAELGYDGEMVNTLPVTNDQGGLLYHLLFASKAPRGTAIWKSISRHHGAQRGLGL
jgi:three-Cys-motif partner protein